MCICVRCARDGFKSANTCLSQNHKWDFMNGNHNIRAGLIAQPRYNTQQSSTGCRSISFFHLIPFLPFAVYNKIFSTIAVFIKSNYRIVRLGFIEILCLNASLPVWLYIFLTATACSRKLLYSATEQKIQNDIFIEASDFCWSLKKIHDPRLKE